jgi:hypothetical protein
MAHKKQINKEVIFKPKTHIEDAIKVFENPDLSILGLSSKIEILMEAIISILDEKSNCTMLEQQLVKNFIALVDEYNSKKQFEYIVESENSTASLIYFELKGFFDFIKSHSATTLNEDLKEFENRLTKKLVLVQNSKIIIQRLFDDGKSTLLTTDKLNQLPNGLREYLLNIVSKSTNISKNKLREIIPDNVRGTPETLKFNFYLSQIKRNFKPIEIQKGRASIKNTLIEFISRGCNSLSFYKKSPYKNIYNDFIDAQANSKMNAYLKKDSFKEKIDKVKKSRERRNILSSNTSKHKQAFEDSVLGEICSEKLPYGKMILK